MRRIFADTSILIAGCGSKTGASRAVLTMAEIGLFKLVVSEQVMEECQRNFKKKLPAAIPIFTQIIAAIDPEIKPNPQLLSLNTKDFTAEVAAKSGLVIQTPAEFIGEVREIVTRGL